MQSPYIFMRNGRYYLRFRVPCDLVVFFHRNEIQRSLGVSDGRVAGRISRSLRAMAEEAFANMRHQRALGASNQTITEVAYALCASQLPTRRRDAAACPNGGTLDANDHAASRLSDALSAFMRDRSGNWTTKTRQMHEFALQLLIRIIGDKPLINITRHDCRRYRDTLAQLPANLTKRYSGVPIERVIALHAPPMSTKSLNKHVNSTVALFNWCVRERLMTDNPARGLSLLISGRADLERDVFNDIHLRVLFGGLTPSMGSRYWLPLVALYSGMRLEEIAQLRVSDLRQEQDVWVFDVNAADGKRLKTDNSRRLVPVHDVLIARGILVHQQSVVREGCSRLWPDMKRANDGFYSSAFSKWFGRYKRRMGMTESTLTFHSFRHTVINCLKQRNVSELSIKELVGHANDSITTARYGKRFEPHVLRKVVNTLDYGNFF